MKKRTLKGLEIVFVSLFLIVILIWQQGLLEKEVFLNLKKILWGTVYIAIIIGFIFIFSKVRNHALLKTVTKSCRGTKSERDLVLKLLKHRIPAENLFHDLYIEKQNGEYSQIDLVALTSVGVVVFEVKDFSGWIYGNGSNSQWTKVLAYGKNKYRFYNPIMQNSKHIQSLRKHIEHLSQLPFYSIVVFYGNCTLKEVSFVPKGTYLVKAKRVLEVMKILEKENEPVYYKNKSEIIWALRKAVLNGENRDIQKQHIENINDMLGKDRIFE
ncbi:MAG: NERD domain-containing protein [Bacteroidales bacterium]|nr:NERD domain-containing protein [Bacteroidales bacterium]